MNTIPRKTGHYLGTKINHHWWRRYSKGGFLTRGIGEYWIKDGSLFFQHQTKQKPIRLPLRDIVEIALCPCKRQTKVGRVPIIKLIWKKDGNWLSSGFALSAGMDEISEILANLRTQAA